jgi:hypothetical protein
MGRIYPVTPGKVLRDHNPEFSGVVSFPTRYGIKNQFEISQEELSWKNRTPPRINSSCTSCGIRVLVGLK